MTDYHENRGGRTIGCAALRKTVVPAGSPDLRKNRTCSDGTHSSSPPPPPPPRCLFAPRFCGQFFSRTSVASARNPVHEINKAHNDFPQTHKRTFIFHCRRTFTIRNRAVDIIMQRMTQRDRPAPASLKVTVSCNFFCKRCPPPPPRKFTKDRLLVLQTWFSLDKRLKEYT